MAATLLDYLRDYLVSQGVGRDPRVAGATPPIWRQPRKGVPAPGEGQNATEIGATTVVGLFVAPGVPTRRHESFVRMDGVDIVVRTTKADAIWSIDSAIRTALDDKRNWSMSGLLVNESLLFRTMQLVASDDQAFTYTTGYLFHIWTS